MRMDRHTQLNWLLAVSVVLERIQVELYSHAKN
jgi:hypothetical protein